METNKTNSLQLQAMDAPSDYDHGVSLREGLGLNKILSTIHIYPTLAEANKYAAGAWRRNGCWPAWSASTAGAGEVCVLDPLVLAASVGLSDSWQ